MDTVYLLVGSLGFLFGVLFILLTLSCAAQYVLRAQVSKPLSEHELSRVRQPVQEHDDGHGPEAEWVLPEPTVSLRGSTRLCTAARSDGPRSCGGRALQVAQDCEATRVPPPCDVYSSLYPIRAVSLCQLGPGSRSHCILYRPADTHQADAAIH